MAHVRRETPEKNFSRASPLFDTTSTISRFGQRFCGGQYSLVNFLFAVLLLTVPPCVQPFVKVGAHAPSVPHGVGATGSDCRQLVYELGIIPTLPRFRGVSFILCEFKSVIMC